MAFVTNLKPTFRGIVLRELQYKSSKIYLQHFSYNLLTNVQYLFKLFFNTIFLI